MAQPSHVALASLPVVIPGELVEAPAGRYRAAIAAALVERRALLDDALLQLRERGDVLAAVAARLVDTLRAGQKVLLVGNGGSAAEAQHFAAELVGRFKRERRAYAAIALTTDTAILTAVANDYGYGEVFARQVHALGSPGDLLIAFSTSGASENLLHAVIAGRERGLTTVAVTGDRPSPLARLAELAICVPSVDTAVTQELHTVVTHLLCDIVEAELMAASLPGTGRP